MNFTTWDNKTLHHLFTFVRWFPSLAEFLALFCCSVWIFRFQIMHPTDAHQIVKERMSFFEQLCREEVSLIFSVVRSDVKSVDCMCLTKWYRGFRCSYSYSLGYIPSCSELWVDSKIKCDKLIIFVWSLQFLCHCIFSVSLMKIRLSKKWILSVIFTSYCFFWVANK